MGKRSDFPRKPRDFYRTPRKAVLPLLPHLPAEPFTYIEPCAGDGLLIRHLEELCPRAHCIWAADIKPEPPMIHGLDAREVGYRPPGVPHKFFITNPPWTRSILHPIIENLRRQAPAWLLLDTDWAHTGQALPYLRYCSKIVAIGRVSWEENGVGGKDNCCWYLFQPYETPETLFYGKE